MELYLASGSPRRRELLAEAGYTFTVVPTAYEEPNAWEGVDPLVQVRAQAQGKACGVEAALRESGIVIGADTIVVLRDTVLGKPQDATEAKVMLRALSGRTHEVVTGLCIVRGDWIDTTAIRTSVTFQNLTEEQIDAYVATGSPLDKAGAYGLQELGSDWVADVSGSISNVVGLPMEAVQERLALMGIPTP